MTKLTFIFLGLFYFSLHAMEAYDEYDPLKWPKMRLGTLLDQAQSTTCCRRNVEIRERKLDFVKCWLEKYEEQQGVLTDLSRETGGVIRATADPELAAKDPNKFYCINVLNFTANQIDARWKQIHHADCKYISESIKQYGSYDKRPLPS